MLAKLAPQYYRPDFGEQQAKALFEAFVEDLADFGLPDIEEAIRLYRRTPANKFFPTSGQLREIAYKVQKERAEASRPRPSIPSEPRPNFWWMMNYWKPHWRENEIPIEWIRAHQMRIERVGFPKIMR